MYLLTILFQWARSIKFYWGLIQSRHPQHHHHHLIRISNLFFTMIFTFSWKTAHLVLKDNHLHLISKLLYGIVSHYSVLAEGSINNVTVCYEVSISHFISPCVSVLLFRRVEFPVRVNHRGLLRFFYPSTTLNNNKGGISNVKFSYNTFSK